MTRTVDRAEMAEQEQKRGVAFWCDRVMRWAYYALIFWLPISTAMVESLSGVVLAALLVKKTWQGRAAFSEAGWPAVLPRILAVWRERIPGGLFNKALIVFVLVNLASVLGGQNMALGWEGVFFKMGQGVILLWGLLECLDRRQHLQRFLIAWLSAAALVGLDGLFQYFNGRDLLLSHLLLDGRVSASLKHPNDLGTYLISVIPLIAALLVGRGGINGKKERGGLRTELRGGLGALLMLMLCVLGMTFSRGAWIAFLVGMIYLGWQHRRHFWQIFLSALVFLVFFTPMMSLTRQTTLLSPKTYTQGEGRVVFWSDAWQVVRDHPVLGTGLNTYSWVSEKYPFRQEGWYVHNCYLQMMAETGVVGLAAFLWLCYSLFRTVHREKGLVQDPFLCSVLLGLAAGLVSFLAHGAIDTNFYSVQLANLMWLMTGILLVTVDLSRRERSGAEFVSPIKRAKISA